MQGKFEGKVELSAIKPLAGYHMKVNGQGAPGFVTGEGNLHLEPNGDGTLLRYEGEIQIGGRIAGVGQRLLDSTAKSLIRQGLTALDEQLQLKAKPPELTTETTGSRPKVPTPPAVPVPPSGTAEAKPPARPAGPPIAKVATTVARDVAQDWPLTTFRWKNRKSYFTQC